MSHIEYDKMLQEFAAKIGEHFDSVQIFVSWTENGRTKSLKKGVGNWYARQGMAHEFINEDIAEENATRIASKVNPPPDDEWKANV